MRTLSASNALLRSSFGRGCVFSSAPPSSPTVLTQLHDFSTRSVPLRRPLAIPTSLLVPSTSSSSSNALPRSGPSSTSYTTRRWKGKKATKASKAAAKAPRPGRRLHEDEAYDDGSSGEDGTPSSSTSGAGDGSDGNGDEGALTQPSDLTELSARYRRAEDHFGPELARIRAGATSAAAANSLGGDALGSVAVRSSSSSSGHNSHHHGGKSSSGTGGMGGGGGAGTGGGGGGAAAAGGAGAGTTPLRELATIAPLGGRRWSIVAHDEANVKAIMSAVQNSDGFNQQPQRAGPDSPCELTMSLDPATPDQLRARARDTATRWRDRIREETHWRESRSKKWRKEGLVGPDAFFAVGKKITALQEKAMKTVADREKEVMNVLAARGGS